MSVNEGSLPGAVCPPLCYQSCASGSSLPLPSSTRSLGSWRQTVAERWFSDLLACVCSVLCLGLPAGSAAWAGRPEGPQRCGCPVCGCRPACSVHPRRSPATPRGSRSARLQGGGPICFRFLDVPELVLEREAPVRKTRVQYAKLVKIISTGLVCLVSSLLVLEVCAACLFEHQFSCALKLY